jgi:deazaflavin-dependent oxidoreductase (nitroreductase family)
VGLGDLLNAIHIMVLTTRGRRSGQPRHVPIEYRRHGRKIYLVSAWGSRPDWVQNVKTDPRVTVQLGRRTQAAQALVVTDPAEALRALYLFRRVAPARYDAVLSAVIEETVNARTLPNVSSQFTIVRLDLSDAPPPLTGLPVHREAAGAVALAGLLGMTLLAIWAALRLRQTR